MRPVWQCKVFIIASIFMRTQTTGGASERQLQKAALRKPGLVGKAGEDTIPFSWRAEMLVEVIPIHP